MKTIYPALCKLFICFTLQLLLITSVFITTQAQVLNGPYGIENVDSEINSFEYDYYLNKNDFYQYNSSFQDHPGNQYFSDQFGNIGLNDFARTIIEYNDTVCIGGDFTWFEGEVRLNHVACWDDTDNSWMPMAEGFNNPVLTLAVYEGDLYAGGSFTLSGEKSISGVAKWNGTEWIQAAGGLDGTVQSLTVHNDELIAGGSFNETGANLGEGFLTGTYTLFQETESSGVAGVLNNGWLFYDQQQFEVEITEAFDGRSFTAKPTPAPGFDLNDRVFTLEFNEESGATSVALTEDIFTGLGCGPQQVLYGISLDIEGSFNPDDDSEFTFGIRDNPLEVCDASFDDVLFTATKINSSNQVANTTQHLNNIARFDGNSWEPLAEGFNQFVTNVAVVNGELYAAGNFTESSGIELNRIARWNGDNWNAVGAGFNSRPNVLTEYDGTLVAAGFFSQSAGVSVSGVAEWDEDTETWLQLGDGFSLSVWDITVYDGVLYVSGALTGSLAEGYSGVQKWNADISAWETVFAEPLQLPGIVYTIKSVGERLAISGNISDMSYGVSHFAFLESGTPEPETELNFNLKGLRGIGGYTSYLYNDQVIVGGIFDVA